MNAASYDSKNLFHAFPKVNLHPFTFTPDCTILIPALTRIVFIRTGAVSINRAKLLNRRACGYASLYSRVGVSLARRLARRNSPLPSLNYCFEPWAKKNVLLVHRQKRAFSAALLKDMVADAIGCRVRKKFIFS